MGKKRLKKIVTTLLVIVYIISSSSIPGMVVKADLSGNAGEGTSDSTNEGTSLDNGLRTDASFQGQRYYIVDTNGNRVSTVLDIVNTAPTVVSGTDGFEPGKTYINAYNESLTELSASTTGYIMKTWADIEAKVPSINANNHCYLPLTEVEPAHSKGITLDSTSPNGDEIKQWVVNGTGGTGTISYNASIDFDNDNGRTNPNKETGTDGTSPGITDGGNGENNVGYILSHNTNSMILRSPLKFKIQSLTSQPSPQTMNKANLIAQSTKNSLAAKSISIFEKNAQIREAVANALIAQGISREVALAAACRVNVVAYNPNSEVAKLDTNNIESLGLQQIIPTDGETTSNEYMLDILNWYDNDNNRLIDFTATELKLKKGELLTDTMGENEYYLVIEPIFWVRYSRNIDTNGDGKVDSVEKDNFFIYGTYRNIVDYFYHVKGYAKSSPNLYILTNVFGWRSMVLESDVNFTNHTIVNPSVFAYDSNGDGIDDAQGAYTADEAYKADCTVEKVSFEVLATYKSTVGYAMHIYKSDYKPGCTKTRDDSKLYKGTGKEHPAPEIPEDEKEKYDEKITIVKTYQVSKDGGKTYKHSSTHVRKDNQILDIIF